MTDSGTKPARVRLDAPRYYVNREISWIHYNARVLDGALDTANPLLERLRFLAYFTTNLDEFFMIRVANQLELEAADRVTTGPDGLTPSELLDAIARDTHALIDQRTKVLQEDILPALETHGVRLSRVDELSGEDRREVEERFVSDVFPVLTPLTVDPTHPFPHLANLSHNLVVLFDSHGELMQDEEISLAIVEIPSVLPPMIQLGSGEGRVFVLMSEVIRHFAGEVFAGLEIAGTWEFRVTRDADLALREPEVEDLLLDVERELRSRHFRRVVRLEVATDMPHNVREYLSECLDVGPRQTYEISGPMNPPALMPLYKVKGLHQLQDPPFNPRIHPRMSAPGSIFSIIREKDILLHHPYESFSTVVELLRAAATDPKVLAMKLTLYRTSGDSVIIDALKAAAREGKQVTAVVELKARFDEKNNIVWARELESAGVHVVYGIVGLKTHCKAAMVVRREGPTTRRYVHVATGNYNSSTARVYTDLGLLTCDRQIGEDVSQLFNVLTGFSNRTITAILDGKIPRPPFHKLVCSPFEMAGRVIGLIEDEIRHHEATGGGLIQAKFNSLVDPGVIRALYRASRAGVSVRLIVRGICCLRPGVPNVSDNIEIISVVDRFLEHSRIFHFRHGGEDRVYMGSADWMPRNLFRRVEAMIPLEDPDVKRRLIEEVLEISFADTARAWRGLPDGTYEKIEPAEGEPVRSQLRFIDLARQAGIKSIPYERAVREPRPQAIRTKSKKKKK